MKKLFCNILNEISNKSALHVLSFHFLLISWILHAQESAIMFDRIGIEQGLSQSSVYSILQDDLGFLWFGTQDGLNKFDGYDFKVFRHDAKDSTSISDNWITSITKDQFGNFWIGTNGRGVNKLVLSSEKFVRFLHNPDDTNSISHDRILCVYADHSGLIWIGTDGKGIDIINSASNIVKHFKSASGDTSGFQRLSVNTIFEDSYENLWIGTSNNGLYCSDKKSGKILHYSFNFFKDFNLAACHVNVIFEDSDKVLWVGTGEGLIRFNSRTNDIKIYKYSPEKFSGISNNNIYNIFEDEYKRLWIATDGGINLLDEKREMFDRLVYDASNPTSLSNDLTRCIFLDNSGCIWIGTYGGGLNKYNLGKKRFRHYKNVAGDPNSINDNTVWSIMIDKSNYLWVGTDKGLNKIDRLKNRVKIYNNNQNNPYSLSDHIARVIFQDHEGVIWVGTNNGGLNKFNPRKENFTRYQHNPQNPSSLNNNTIRTILEDKYTNLWIGTWEGLDKFNRKSGNFTHYMHDPNNKNSLCDNRVRCLYQDHLGNVWIGTYGGLNKFNPKTEEFISYLYDENDEKSISHSRVLTLCEDEFGDIWIGTYGGGLSRLKPNTDKFIRYTEKDGLANNSIYGILSDNRGCLWISTNKGISKYSIINDKFTNYDANDGLQSDEFNGGAYYQSKEGELFFGGINGYNSFFPGEISSNTFEPPVVVTSFKIFDNEIELDTTISRVQDVNLSYTQNFFSFEFASLDYTNPEKNKYMYRLDGFDLDWMNSGKRRFANYTNVSGGNYTFMLKGTNSDGLWNEEITSLQINVEPPFWQTLWFRITGILLIISMIYSIYRYRVRSISQQKELLEKQVQERTQQLSQTTSELKMTNIDLIEAKSSTDNILKNVEEGLFVIDENFKINAEYSAALDGIFNTSHLGNKNLLKILIKRTNVKTVSMTKDFLQLMLDGSVDENLIMELNPLIQTEFKSNNTSEKVSSLKYLSFRFKRIYDQNKKIKLISTVKDITDRVNLATELEQSQEQTKRQMELLTNILHVEPEMLKEFIESAQSELKDVTQIISQGEAITSYSENFKKIYRSMHLIKGNASLLDLSFFADKAHKCEDIISGLLRKPEIQSEDLVPLNQNLNKIENSINEIKSLIEKISQIHSQFRPKRSFEGEKFIKSIDNFVNHLTKDAKKQVVFNYDDFDAISIPHKYRLMIKDILIQLVRNAITHGIETPNERKKNKKSKNANIVLRSKIVDNCFTIFFKDDGRGLNIEKLRQRAKESGKWNKSDIDKWSEKQVAEIIFESGISTADKTDMAAGRGVGMDIIMDKMKNNNGKIEINFKDGQYCEFKIVLPVN